MMQTVEEFVANHLTGSNHSLNCVRLTNFDDETCIIFAKEFDKRYGQKKSNIKGEL
jgi:hypothetical protein